MPDPTPPAAPRTARPPVVYVAHRVPFPPDKGDRIRNTHVLRELAARADVHLLALADEPVAPDTLAALRGLCVRVEIVPVTRRRWARAAAAALAGKSLSAGLFRDPRVDATLAAWAKELPGAAVVVSAAALAPYLKRHNTGGRRVADLVDVDSQKWLDFAAHSLPPKRWLYRFEGRRLRELERLVPAWTDAVTLVSRAEADVFDAFTRPGAATVATNGVDLDYFAPVPPDVPVTRSLAFVGAMDYLPNVDAATWFADDVWPLVRNRYPDAEFRVVGRKPSPAVTRLAGRPGIVVTGSVPDVRPFVASAAVVVAPVRVARGLQNKVLEAMAMAKAVIAGPPALAALSAKPGVHLLSAATPAEWVAAVGNLFDSPPRRARLGAAARKFVEANHHWGRCLKPLADAVVPAAT